MRWFCVLVVCEFPSLDVEEKFFVYLLCKLVEGAGEGGGGGVMGWE